jgi:hypothetical protein
MNRLLVCLLLALVWPVQAAERVVSLAPSLTEIVVELGPRYRRDVPLRVFYQVWAIGGVAECSSIIGGGAGQRSRTTERAADWRD